VIDDGVVRGPEQPGAHALPLSEPWKAPMDLEEDLLDDVVHIRRRAHPARHVSAQAMVELVPDGFRL